MILKALVSVTFIILATPAFATSSCPTKPQTIKIIDLKSGWWQGDGGDTDQYVMKHIQAQCPNVTFKYTHTLYGGFSTFQNPPVIQVPLPLEDAKPANDNFDQIWLLSGGEADGADIRIDSPDFQKYLKEMKDSAGNLFIGSGFGNVYHANATTEGLGLGALFVTDRETHEYPSPHSGLTVIDTLLFSPSEKVHTLLKDISDMPNEIKVGGFLAVSDSLASSVNVIARDSQGKTVIGESTTTNGRKLIMDANLARTYMIRKNDPAIQKYLINLVKTLEH